MTQEDKAKRYDEAISQLKGLLDSVHEENCDIIEEDIVRIFPELAESEDEKIRKALLEHIVRIDSEVPLGAYHRLNGVDISEIITWLEKQDSKTNPYSGISFEYNGHIWGMCARDNGVDILCDKYFIEHLEKQGEQKPVEWKQENVEELSDFENAMMHIGGSFFGENAGLDPNDTASIKEQAELLLELASKTEWSEEDEAKLKSACALIRNTSLNGNEGVVDSTIDWLKSLKEKQRNKYEMDINI